MIFQKRRIFENVYSKTTTIILRNTLRTMVINVCDPYFEWSSAKIRIYNCIHTSGILNIFIKRTLRKWFLFFE